MAEYVNPIDEGYKRFKLTKKQHNEIYKKHPIRWTDKYEYYYKEGEIILHLLYSKKLVLYKTIKFPGAIFKEGLINFDETCDNLEIMYTQKKRNKHKVIRFEGNSEECLKTMEIIKATK